MPTPWVRLLNLENLPVAYPFADQAMVSQWSLNKYSKVRAALCWDVELAKLAREHNDANVLSIPARFVSEEQVKAILAAFLDTPFEGGRHEARVAKIPIKH